MTYPQIGILGILAITMAMFLWGKWRHDMVAMGALLACVIAGLVPAGTAFAGFGHPAVVTVACVLVLSRSLLATGAIDALTQRLIPSSAGPTATIAALTVLGAVLSAFMNNVGTLALLMPVAIQLAEKQGLPPGRTLMPLAFASILGGMTTLIGTPPNMIVSGFRETTGSGSFAMFDFTPVGIAVAAAGVAFIALIGWRLVPPRQRSGVEGFDTGTYITEARIPDGGKAVGKTLREVDSILNEVDAQVIGFVRNHYRVSIPDPGQTLNAGDILVIEAEPEMLSSAISSAGLELEEDRRNQQQERGEPPPAEESDEGKVADASEIELIELTVRPGSDLVGRSATGLRLRSRFHINLLAFSRRGKRSIRRLRSVPIQAGDVLLMQGAPAAIQEFASDFDCIPLAGRSIRIPDKRRAIGAVAIMATSIVGAAFGLLPAAISFAAGVLALMAFRIVSPRGVYDAIDWPVIVLLGALIPVAGAMESSGTADVIARFLLDVIARGQPLVGLAVILVVTMTLSDFMNNAATAAVMCPIAISTASQLSSRPDSFLMAVAIGASCAFLTPIGHQNNTLILGPGGFRFGDYWRLGLPLEMMVAVICLIVLPLCWPL
jgi:di/tricarboxylate transporter